MNKKRKAKVVKVTTVKGGTDGIAKGLRDMMVKSGAVESDDTDTVKTSVADSTQSDTVLTDEMYLSICESEEKAHDGSTLDDEAKADYLAGLDDEAKADTIKKDRILVFRGSDETPDRAGDIIRVNGWQLKNYRKNPVFLAFHKRQAFPCGRTVKVWKEANDKGAYNGKSLMFAVHFPEGNEWADFVYRQYKDGLMNATSVGFTPIKASRPESLEEAEKLGLGRYGVEFTKQELTELSGVPVPCNQNALLVKSADTKELASRIDALKDLEVEYVKDDNDDNDDVKDDNDEVATALKELTSVLKGCMSLVSAQADLLKSLSENLKVEVTVKSDGWDFEDEDDEPSKEDVKDVYGVLMKTDFSADGDNHQH